MSVFSKLHKGGYDPESGGSATGIKGEERTMKGECGERYSPVEM
jgi:hypothetical protein